MTVRILAAHGTGDPQGQATVRAIADAVSAEVGPVRVAWLDVLRPRLTDHLAELSAGTPVDIVPLLLSEGFHGRSDIPSVVAATAPHARVAPVLGAEPPLIRALADRLVEAGWAGEPVVLGATGSARDSWHVLAHEVAGALAERLGVTVELGVMSGPGRSVTEAFAAQGDSAAVSAYLLAEGFFHTRLQNTGAALTTAPIGVHSALIDVLVERFGQL